ncbi:unnamed protein product [Leptidea sinapis]|uniref:Uncharacterized protein n=1 Tax=Leptidea sinapis TaxID=189913 RepID=A0A5E4QI97_9NEOP|nr:unnamed protein product [Leptidea sinapis]
MDELVQFVKKSELGKSRKRPAIKSKWKREVREKRYKAAGLPKYPTCNHNQKAFQCKQLTMQMIRKFYEKFYLCSNKFNPEAKRKKNDKRTKAMKYNILGDKGAKVPVCQKTFMGALLVKKDRIQGVLKRFYESGGQMPLENRDRVFDKIEKVIKTKEVITSPTEYVSVLQEHTQCTDLASIPVYDWKTSYQNIIKLTTSWHFAFMKYKRIFITRTKTENVLVQGEVNYRAENNTKMTITKKGKKITMIQPDIIQPNKIIPNAAKLHDVLKLLKTHFGDNWETLETLTFYKIVKERAQETTGKYD